MKKHLPRKSKQRNRCYVANDRVAAQKRGIAVAADKSVVIPTQVVLAVVALISKMFAAMGLAMKRVVSHALTALVTTLLLPHLPPTYAALLGTTHDHAVISAQVDSTSTQMASAQVH